MNGNLINENTDAFNDYFSNIGPDLANQIGFNDSNRSYLDYLPNLNNNINATFQMKEINPSTVFALLSTLSRSKATGLDKISSRLLRECPDLITESLCLIFNRCITTGIFPHE